MQIIRRREFHKSVTYTLVFDLIETSGRSYTFDCDEHGTVIIERLPPEGINNFINCTNKIHNVKDGRVVKYHRTWSTPPVGLCDCGKEIELDHFTNTCDCGADYNSAGQLLAPRSQWGEETGESLSDILSVDNMDANPFEE